jgi:hypothetical protein
MLTKKIKGSLAFITIALFFSSCTTVYFDSPQPLGVKNTYEFPEKQRGMWIKEKDTVVIGKNYFHTIRHENKIVSKNDSLYLIKDNRVYPLDNSRHITGAGSAYKTKGDSIYFDERKIADEIELGTKAFIRKINDTQYLLNIKSENQWWQIYLVEETKDGSILTLHCGEQTIAKGGLANVKKIHSAEDNYYFEARWTKDDFKNILKDGAFADTLKLDLNLNKKLSLK